MGFFPHTWKQKGDRKCGLQGRAGKRRGISGSGKGTSQGDGPNVIQTIMYVYEDVIMEPIAMYSYYMLTKT